MAHKASILMGSVFASVLFAGGAFAQTATGGEAMAEKTAPADTANHDGAAGVGAAGATSEAMGAHDMTGTVTSIGDKGIVGFETGVGELKLHFPPAALEGVKEGDKLTVHLSFEKA